MKGIQEEIIRRPAMAQILFYSPWRHLERRDLGFVKALILAAGDGGRLGSLTEDKPKALVQVLGMSLIEWVILTAKQAGINEFLVVCSYLGEKLKSDLGAGTRFGVKIDYIDNEDWQMGDGISALKARDFLDEKFSLLMADHHTEKTARSGCSTFFKI